MRARWFASNQFVPPPETHLVDVRPIACFRSPDGTVRVTARFVPPAGTPNVDPFDVVVGSDPSQPPGAANVGLMIPIDANGNEIGPHLPFPQDLTGATQGPLPATITADVPVTPTLAPPAGAVRIAATVSARQATRTGVQIIGRRLRTCDLR